MRWRILGDKGDDMKRSNLDVGSLDHWRKDTWVLYASESRYNPQTDRNIHVELKCSLVGGIRLCFDGKTEWEGKCLETACEKFNA